MLELSAFISAMKSGKNADLKLLLIFFMIKPKDLSDVTKYGPEWQKLEVSNDTKDKWQYALNEVRSINGLLFGKDGNEVDCRDNVVDAICCLLKGINTESSLQLLDFNPVGIEEQVQEVRAQLDMEGAQSALAVIVCGFGGVGKTTLAASVVQSLDWSSTDFKFCMVAIDENTPDKTSHIISLQKHIISKLGGVKLDFQNHLEGRCKIKEILKKKCCLLFIDNVVDKDYIRHLLPQDLWSDEQDTKLRIIITSREKNVKAELNITCKEYDVNALCDAASERLLYETIVQSEVVEDKGFGERHMISEIAAACRGVPLLLSVFGKHLRVERDKDSYEEALHVLREGNLDSYRDEDLGTKLMFVYRKIKDVEVKEAFLDICTYFHGWKWNLVADIVDIFILRDLHRSMLVSKSSSDEVIVHDILRLMGMREARLARFSNYIELSHALGDNLDGLRNVKGISLVHDYDLKKIPSTTLEAMHQSLRVLMLGDWVTLDGPPCDRAFRNLRYLRVGDIAAFPFKDPSKLEKLRVFLNMSKLGMNLSHLPSSLKRITHKVPDVQCDKFAKLPFQNLSSLKNFIVQTWIYKSVELPEELYLPASLVDLNLSGCKNLPKNIGHLTALESLNLDRSDLKCLPQGFGKLKKLKHFSMKYCSKLASLSEELGHLTSLEYLSLDRSDLKWLPQGFGKLKKLKHLSMKYCSKLAFLSEELGHLAALESLTLDGSDLKCLPLGFGKLKKLRHLSMNYCSKLVSLSEDFGLLCSLEAIRMADCQNLRALPESLGELHISSLELVSLENLQKLPNSFGYMPLLKDLRLESCHSLMSLPDSFVQLKMLETLKIIMCTKLSILPEDFGQLRCLKHMTMEDCHLLKELPHGFGALAALKTFTLTRCKSFVNLPRDFTELTGLEELYLRGLPLISRMPDGLGKLEKLNFLILAECFQLKTLSDDFENMATLEQLAIGNCPELDGEVMEKIVKLQHCYVVSIQGSRKLFERWKHMQSEIEHLIAVFVGDSIEDEGRAMRVALLNGKYVEVNDTSGELMERSSLLEGMEEGTTATVALILLPTPMQSYQHQTLQRFVEMARETAKTNGSSKLQIVCVTKNVRIAEEEKADEGVRQILVSLPKGSCAIPPAESKRLNLITYRCDPINYYYDGLRLFTADVAVDIEGRKSYQNLKFKWEREIWKVENDHHNSIQTFFESICPRDNGGGAEGQSQSECVAGESKTREFVEALKSNGIDYLLTNNNTSKVMVDDLQGKSIGFIICNFKLFECIKLQQIYKDLQQEDSNFIAIWIPSPLPSGPEQYTRLIQCMPCATFPNPQLFRITGMPLFFRMDPRFVVLDKEGQIENQDALSLLLGWGVKFYPFTPHTIRKSFFSMESESCLEFLLHGMSSVGRKPTKSKMTFLYAQHPREWLKMKYKLEELTQIYGGFEVLYVGKLDYNDDEEMKQDYENATQDMRWPSLSFSDMMMFWYRCKYLASEEGHELNKESNTMMETLHGLAFHFCHCNMSLVLVDKDGVVTRGGEDVVEMIGESRGEISEGERMVVEELMRGECGPLVKRFFREEIYNHPQHPQHPISLSSFDDPMHPLSRFPFHGVYYCDVCYVSLLRKEKRAYRCGQCNWDMCGSCWKAYAKQLLLAKHN